eukprot:m.288395 g.288395  ORF g.288395 m.288395 type:complete len:365 (+) comp55043_c0_seq2:93-1187(+)
MEDEEDQDDSLVTRSEDIEPSSQGTESKRRYLSVEKRKRLEEAYSHCTHPASGATQQLALELGEPIKRVQSWFKKKRAKMASSAATSTSEADLLAASLPTFSMQAPTQAQSSSAVAMYPSALMMPQTIMLPTVMAAQNPIFPGMLAGPNYPHLAAQMNPLLSRPYDFNFSNPFFLASNLPAMDFSYATSFAGQTGPQLANPTPLTTVSPSARRPSALPSASNTPRTYLLDESLPSAPVSDVANGRSTSSQEAAEERVAVAQPHRTTPPVNAAPTVSPLPFSSSVPVISSGATVSSTLSTSEAVSHPPSRDWVQQRLQILRSQQPHTIHLDSLLETHAREMRSKTLYFVRANVALREHLTKLETV